MIDTNAGIKPIDPGLVVPDHDAVRIHFFDHATAAGEQTGTGILGHVLLHTGADDGCAGFQQRDCLALHVRAHERPVGIVVLEEGNEGGGDRHHLVGRHVHHGHVLGRDHGHFALVAGNQVVLEDPAVNDRHLRRRDHLIFLLGGGEVLAVHRNLSVFDHSVRCLDEAVRIDGGIGGQRND